VCSDANSNTKQIALEKTLANRFYIHCTAWCLYDYDTIINNVRTGSDDHAGFRWNNGDSCWNWVTAQQCFVRKYNEYLEVMSRAGVQCATTTPTIPLPTTSPTTPSPVPQPTSTPTTCELYYTWTEERSIELCPSESDYGHTDKSFGVSVCSDANSNTKQIALEKTLANRFYIHCTAWCLYDYDTIINNVRTGSDDHAGFRWNNGDSCWNWVTAQQCFVRKYNEYLEVMSRAGVQCAAQ